MTRNLGMPSLGYQTSAGGRPGMPRAFLSQTLQGVNYLCNTWHGVLAPLTDDATFIVVDRIGVEENLEDFFDTPYLIVE